MHLTSFLWLFSVFACVVLAVGHPPKNPQTTRRSSSSSSSRMRTIVRPTNGGPNEPPTTQNQPVVPTTTDPVVPNAPPTTQGNPAVQSSNPAAPVQSSNPAAPNKGTSNNGAPNPPPATTQKNTKGNPPNGSPPPHGNTALHPSNTANSNPDGATSTHAKPPGPSATTDKHPKGPSSKTNKDSATSTSKKNTEVHSTTASNKKESATTSGSVTKSQKSTTNTKTTLSRSSSSSKTPKATGAVKWEGENNEHLCKDGQMTTDSWKSNNVDHYLKQFWDEYPHNPLPQYGGEVIKGKAFSHYLAQITGDYGNFKCHPVECDLDANDQAQCEKHPMIGFIMFAIKNFQIYYETMNSALNNQHSSWSDKINKMTLDFTWHELKAPPSAVPFIIMGALFGGLGIFGAPAFGATGAAVAAAGAGGAAASGFGTAAASSASDDRIDVLQKEIKNTATMSEAFGKVRDGIWGAINDTATAVLDTTPGKEPKGLDAPSVLGGGFFADHPEVGDETKFNDQFAKSFGSSIVASSWYADQVFIVKIDPKKASVDGTNGCDGDLGKTMNKARVCVDGIGYVFVRTDDIGNLNGGNPKWKNPAGISKLKDHDLSLEKLAKAAEWYEKNIGAWNEKGITKQDIQDFVRKKKDGPPGGLWVNLPIIDYEKTPPKNPKNLHYNGRGSARDHILNNVGAWIKPKKDWPYKSLA